MIQLDKLMRNLFSIFIFLVVTPIFAQEQSPVVAEKLVMESNEKLVETDSILKTNYQTENQITPRKFSPNYQKKYRDEDFDYRLTKPRESIFAKFERWLSKILQTLFGEFDTNKTGKYTSLVIRIFVILLVGFLLYFIITKFFLKEGNFFFSKKNEKLKIATEDLHENIHEINFEKSISEFELQQNYRSAIRYQFLYLLKKLSDQKRIDWNIEKTNRDYSHELKNKDQKTQFDRLTYIFENVWYGEINLDHNRYNSFKTHFNNFK